MSTTTTPTPEYRTATPAGGPGDGGGKGTGALVCGILSIPLAFLFFPVGLLLGVIAVILGVMARRESAGTDGKATGGLITGVLGLVIGVAMLLFVGTFFAKHGKDISACSQQTTQAAQQQCLNQRMGNNSTQP